jgi:hypothetical protein
MVRAPELGMNVRQISGLLTAVRQLALLFVLTAAVVLALSGPALAGCPEGDGDGACESAVPAMTMPPASDVDLPYVDEITAPPVGTALTFGDPE